jgi:hypothetical protein
MKNTKLTQLDLHQIQKRSFDEENDAQRVTIIGGNVPDVKVNVDPSAITNAVKAGFSGLTFPVQPVQQQSTQTVTQIQRIEVPVIVKETIIERVEIPTIVKEVVYKEIKMPVETIRTIEVEKPIVTREIQVIEKSTMETKYLRIVSVVLFITQLISLLYILKAK